MEETCPNCGVVLSESPEEDGLHPVQMETPVEGGEAYCEACVFGGSDAEASEGQYDHTGDEIVRAAAVDAPDEELAGILADSMKAEELRSWMSHNGITRPRGATKAESAAAAVERDRTAVAAYADVVEGIADRDPATAICSCGFEQRFPSEDRAVEAADEHAEETGHEPKAWADDGRRLRG